MFFRILWLNYFLMFFAFPFDSQAQFIATREELAQYSNNENVVIIASTGRSGSSLLAGQIVYYASNYIVTKTHLLPPDKNFKGKILFIFSDPNKASESILYLSLRDEDFVQRHFVHMETSDRKWLNSLGSLKNQTIDNNLLSYDALGIYKQLAAWLHTRTKVTSPSKAHILAIKYENLWDKNSIEAIKDFLRIPEFQLPARLPRGNKTDLFLTEVMFKNYHNRRTKNKPRYEAYEKARILWKQAPPLQYLKIRS